VDPWTEAFELARLPGETANLRLASLLERLPDRPSENGDGGAIVDRLIALLPHGVNPPAASVGPSRRAVTAVGSGAAVLIYVFAMATAMGVFGVNNSHHRPFAQISAKTPISMPAEKRTFPTSP
jgi:hypothetical protein